MMSAMPEADNAPPTVSVIIPTYNRNASLLRALESLSRQTYPVDQFEVIVVDDGGEDGTEAVVQSKYPFELYYLRQPNQGATVARNHGAEHSQGDHLVFMDDDIVSGTTTLLELILELTSRQKTIILGALHLPQQVTDKGVYSGIEGKCNARKKRPGGYVPFQECMTGLLAVRRSDFYRLEEFQDPTGGWPNWDDVDFGYRASQADFRFWRCASAVAEHWDCSVADLGVACARWYRASKSAPRLFRKHPALKASIPMFRDKDPIAWRQDPPALIARKLVRQIVSSPSSLRNMENLVRVLEARYPSPVILERLYRWIGSAYIFRGYRDGLKELGCQPVSAAGRNR